MVSVMGKRSVRTEYLYSTLRAFIAIWGVLLPLVGSLEAASLLEYRFSEEQPPNTMVGNVLRDYGLHPRFSPSDLAQMRLHFRRTDGNYEYFQIEADSGVLRSKKLIDREILCPDPGPCDVHLDVVVGPSQFFHIIKIIVAIDDVNDQRPTFDPDAVSLEISEAARVGSLMSLPGAIDRDGDDYGVKRYELSPLGTPFDLKVNHHRDGTSAIQLHLVERLDREVQDSYRLVVSAFDGGSPARQGHLNVNVTVADANDNSPLFDLSTYKVNLSQSLPLGSQVVRVHATDRDLGVNARIFYGFEKQTEAVHGETFRIDNLTGQVTTKAALHYHSSEDKIHLRVKATDSGSSPLFAIARITITIVDTNNNPPEMTLSTLTASGKAEVDEHALIGSFVAHVKVHDPDRGESGKVTCSVSPSSDFFLDSQYEGEYTVLTARIFDREADPRPKEAILDCEDRGSPPVSTVKVIQVTILDINDHGPQIQEHFKVTIPENNVIGMVLLHLNATDEDSGPNSDLRYQMDHPGDGRDTAPIVIDPMSGTVTANVVFNYEWRRIYTQRVTVCDRGDPPRCAHTTLTVEILDINDEPPIFSRTTYHFDVAENQIRGSVVGTVSAEDADANLAYRKTVYHLHGFDGYFEVDRDRGEIRTLRPLDREEHSVFRGSVSAFNEDFPSLRATANVIVHVGDENDNAPTIIFPTGKDPTVEVPCRVHPGSAVARVQATDPDDGPAGTVTYSLTTNSNFTPLFEIDPTTGVIVVGGTTQYKYECGVYWVTVRATDQGVPRRSTLVDVFVSLNASILPTKQETAAEQETSNLTSSKHDYVILFPTLVLGVVMVIVAVVSVFLLYRCYRRGEKKKREEKQRRDEPEVVDDGDTFPERMDFHEMTRLKRHNSSRSRSLYGSGKAVRYMASDTESDSGCSASDESDKRTAATVSA